MKPHELASVWSAVFAALALLFNILWTIRAQNEARRSREGDRQEATTQRHSDAQAATRSREDDLASAREMLNISLKKLRDDHDYRRRLYAAQLISRYDDRTVEARRDIFAFWSDLLNLDRELPWSSIKKKRDEQLALTKKPALLITDQITVILNYFESLAIALESKTADEETLKKAFHQTLPRWVTVLAGYRRQLQQDRGYDPWEPLGRLLISWSRSQGLERRDATGQSNEETPIQ